MWPGWLPASLPRGALGSRRKTCWMPAARSRMGAGAAPSLRPSPRGTRAHVCSKKRRPPLAGVLMRLRGLGGGVVGPLIHTSAPSGRLRGQEVEQALLRRQAARHIGFGAINEILVFHKRNPNTRRTVVREGEDAPTVLGKNRIVHRSAMPFERTKRLALEVPHACGPIRGGGHYPTSTLGKSRSGDLARVTREGRQQLTFAAPQASCLVGGSRQHAAPIGGEHRSMD